MLNKINALFDKIINTNIFQKLREEKNLVLILLLCSFFLFFFKLGAPTLFETDEVIYSQVAREMRRTGDFITLHLHGHKWFIHPPMYMWLVSLSSFIFGENEFNSRLWCAIFGVALVYLTFLVGKKMFKNGVGILAAFILATSFQFIIQSRLAIFDVPLVFFMLLSVYFFFCWQESKNDPVAGANGEKYYYWFFASIGLATLMKGPVGIALPILVIFPFLFIRKDLPSVFGKKFFKGVAICLAIGGSWYLLETLIHGREFFDRVVGFYLITRYTGVVETHSGPWFYYFPVIILGLLPWTLFLPYSLYHQARRTGDENNLFTILWIAIVFLFFTLAGTKLPGYILSLYPFFAISIAKMFLDYMSGENAGLEKGVVRTFKLIFILSVVTAIVGFLFGAIEVRPNLTTIFFDLNMMLLILGLGSFIATVLFFIRKEIFTPVIIFIATMLIFTFYTASYTMIHFDEFKPMKAISKTILSKYEKNDKIVNYNYAGYKNSFVWYLDKPISWVDSKGGLIRELYSRKRVFLIAKKDDYYNVVKKLGFNLYQLDKAGDLILLSNIE